MPAERTFRVFISSTIEDFKVERSVLQATVFPNLKRYCRERGAGFQPIDLRWGVSEEASLDQRAMSICLAELRRCQLISPRPNFLLLLGDRYGWRPLPEQIPAAEFNLIARRLAGSAEAELLRKWYRLDENAAPAGSAEAGAYVLLPRTGPEREYAVWLAEIERPLGTALRRAVADLGLTEEARVRYEASATHREIIAGALAAPDAESHVFAYFRALGQLPEGAVASGFRDLSDGRPDADAEARLAALKTQVRARLPDSHVFEYQISWPARQLTEAREEFAQRVERDLRRVIDEELSALETKSARQWEDEAHRNFALERRIHFVGRAEMCTRLLDHVAGGENRPLVVCGEAGVGKSALLAEAATRLPPGRLCLRFAGATPETNDLRGLLESVASYLAEEQPAPTALAELRPWLAGFLGQDHEEPHTLVIDGLDELSGTDEGGPLWDWLPRRLGRGVRVIVSVAGTPERPSRWLDSARATYGEAALCALGPLSAAEGAQLLDRMLAARGRRLLPLQSETVLGAFARSGSPLHLRLLAEQACGWRSFDALPVALPAEVPGVIASMLETLARPENHGGLLVAKALGYLLASRHGIAEDELLSVLALDEEFFDAFLRQARHDVPAGEHQLPVVVWARLHADLAPYLSEHRTDGARLLAFRDRQVAEGARQLFTTPDSQIRAHAMLAQLFHGRSQAGPESSPLRRFVELPFQLAEAQQWDELTATLASLDFAAAKAAAGLSYDLLADYDRLLPQRPGHAGVAQLRHLVWRAADGLRRLPELACQQVQLGLARFAGLDPNLAAQSTAMAAETPDQVEAVLPEFAAEQLALPVGTEADAIVSTARGVLVWQKGGRWVETGANGAPLATGHSSGAPVTRLALSGGSLAAACAQFVLLWPHWPAGGPQSIRCASPVQRIAWSEDGSRLLIVGQSGAWWIHRRPESAGAWPMERSGSGAGRVIEAWLEADGSPRFITADGQLRRPQDGGYHDIRLVPGEPACAVCEGLQQRIFIGQADGTLSLIADSGATRWSVSLPAPARRLSLSGPRLLAALSDGSLWTCAAATGTEVRSLAVSQRALADVAPIEGGEWAVTRDYVGGVALVPLVKPKAILAPHPLSARGRIRALHWDTVAGGLAGVDQDGVRFAVTREGGVWVEQPQPAAPSPTGDCLFLPDGRLISVQNALSDNEVYVHERHGGRTQKVWPRVLAFEKFLTLGAIGVSPDGAHGALAIRRPVVGGAQICLFETTPWREMDRFVFPENEVLRIAAADGLTRVLFGFAKLIDPPVLWTRNGMVKLPIDGGVGLRGYEAGDQHSLSELAISAAGVRYLAIDRHGDLWQFDHPRDGLETHRKIGSQKIAVDLSPDGLLAAVLSRDMRLEVLQLNPADDPHRLCELIPPWNIEVFRLVQGHPMLLLGGRGAVCAYSFRREVSTP